MALRRPHPADPHRAIGRLAAVVALALIGLLAPLAGPTGPAGAGAPNLCDNNPTYAHVCGGYQGYADRNPATAELEYWALQSPFPRTAFNSILGKSVESRRITIRAYYDYFADYDPGAAALDYWEGEVLEPNGLRRLESALLGSHVGTIDGYLSRVFQAELDREPTIGEQTYWGTRAVATTRTKVAAEVSATLESRRLKVHWAYQNEVGYAPGMTSREYWAERLRTGTSFLEMRIVLKYSTLDSTGYCSSPAPVLGGIPC
ncbi:MAG TPA: hypothetical protein VK507_24785 [Iamia sp.]|nr:hypothetical protein [Iamia sp.]